MSFFKKLISSPVKHTKAALNVAKNPTDKDAWKSYSKDALTDMFMPGMEVFQKDGKRASGGGEAVGGGAEIPQYLPQVYQAPPQYQSFASLFNQPQFDYSQVGDVYQRGAMPNNLLNRYNSLMQNLQSQQTAMVPRPQPAPASNVPSAGGQLPPMTRVNPYVDFARLFGGR